MVQVNAYSTQEIKKYNNINGTQTQAEAPETMDHTKRDKEQNTDVFMNHLTATQQQVIIDAIGKDGDGNISAWGSPEKIAEALQKAGYEAKVGKDGDVTFIEVKGKDGKNYKIWDVGGDSGLGSQDIGFNNQLAAFKQDVKATAQTGALDFYKSESARIKQLNSADPYATFMSSIDIDAEAEALALAEAGGDTEQAVNFISLFKEMLKKYAVAA